MLNAIDVHQLLDWEPCTRTLVFCLCPGKQPTEQRDFTGWETTGDVGVFSTLHSTQAANKLFRATCTARKPARSRHKINTCITWQEQQRREEGSVRLGDGRARGGREFQDRRHKSNMGLGISWGSLYSCQYLPGREQ